MSGNLSPSSQRPISMRSFDSVIQPYDCWLRTEYETENDEERPINPNTRTIIAIDYGTTYTGIAFVIDSGDGERISTSMIRCVGKYPGAWEKAHMIGERAVPTESCYPQSAKDMEDFRPEALQPSDSEGEPESECGRRCRSSSPAIDDGSVNTLKNTENTVTLTYSY
jgi:hypothetical protein